MVIATSPLLIGDSPQHEIPAEKKLMNSESAFMDQGLHLLGCKEGLSYRSLVAKEAAADNDHEIE